QWLGGLQLAMLYEYRPRWTLEAGQPAHQFITASMGREHGQLGDLGDDRHPVSVDLHLPGPSQYLATTRVRRLKTREQQRIAMVPSERSDMVQHAAAAGHTAGGEDDLGIAIARQCLGLLHVANIINRTAGRLAFVSGEFVIVVVTMQQLSSAGGHGTVEIHGYVPQPSGLFQSP